MGVLRRDKKTKKNPKSRPGNRKIYQQAAGKKKGSVAGRFQPKSWPKTAAKSSGKLGNKRIYSGVLRRDNYRHFFALSSPGPIYSHFRLEFPRSVLQSLSWGVLRRYKKTKT